jgi:hypothetical protein
MGRKGVSKRKPSQNKSKIQAAGAANDSVSAMVHTESESGKGGEPMKSGFATKNDLKDSSNQKNKSKK